MDIGKVETCVKYTRVILKPAQKMSIFDSNLYSNIKYP